MQGGRLTLGSWVAGRYRLDSVLGEGGFGTVYVATRPADAVQVALKIFHPRALEHVGGEARFRREAELARRLDHPNIVKVLDEGVDETTGARFIAFELLRGRSLADELGRWGAMQPRRAIEVAMGICEALEQAHALGIVHRDLKPANVFILDTGDRIKVLDFGIAKSTNPGTFVGLTAAGQALGTPAYMATEQLTGGAIGPATDLFALGIMLLEMLLGRLPFPDRASGMEIVRERLMGQAVPIPDDLRASPLGPLLARATALEPAQRIQSAAEMRSALEELLRSTEVTRTAPSTNDNAADALGPTAGFALGETEVGPRMGPPPIAQAVPQPWSGVTPGSWAPPPPRRGSPGLLLAIVGLGLAVFSVVGVVALLVHHGVEAEREDRRETSRNRLDDEEDLEDDSEDEDLEVDSEDDDLEVDSEDDAPMPPVDDEPLEAPMAASRVVACPGAARENEATLQHHLASLGWGIDGVLTYCAGSMVNFRCLGGQGRGVTASRDGHSGSAVVLRFSSPAEASRHADEQRRAPAEVTWGTDGSSLLRLEMGASDADRMLARICPTH